MRRISLAVIVFLFVHGLRAQKMNVQVKWGEEFSASRSSVLNDIVGSDASGMYIIKEKLLLSGSRLTLEHLRANFVVDKSFELEMEEDGNPCEVDYLVHIKGKILMFYSISDQKTKKNTLFAKEIDKASLKPRPQRTKIGEIDYANKKKRNNGNFYFDISRDSSKIMVVYTLPTEQEEPAQFGIHVLDGQLNSLWQKEVKLPYPGNLFDVATFRVDNEGNAYVLGLRYTSGRSDKKEPNYKYEIFALRNHGANQMQYPIEVSDVFLSQMQIEILDNRNVVCSGFYSEKGNISVGGTYFLVIDPATKEIKTKSFKAFSLDFITQNMSAGDARKAVRKEEKGKEPELYEYDLDKLLVGKDGSVILIGEQFFTTSVLITSGATSSRMSTRYNYNDIIVVKISPVGEIDWVQKVPKTQHTVDDYALFSSYTSAIIKGKICFIFNDHPDNLGTDIKGRPENFVASKSVVVMVSLDQHGVATKQLLFSTEDAEVIIRPKVCEQISNQNVILFGQRKKSQQFARLTIQ